MADSLETINVIATESAEKSQISLPLKTTTLSSLKKELQCPGGSRIFHLGRELKSGGRTLEKLGIGKFHNFNLHIVFPQEHSIQQQRKPQVEVQQVEVSQQKQDSAVVDLLDDEEDDDQEVEVLDSPGNKRRRVED
mmetsp:Transcript_19414/g.29188  ORF Transcript_19414/g.29188 Transcript_19414/m.29188 type:complete len:136 (+) Transcript_19414:82-489(+)